MNILIIFGTVLAWKCVLQIPFVQGIGFKALDVFDETYASAAKHEENLAKAIGTIDYVSAEELNKFKTDLYFDLNCAYRGLEMCKKDDINCLLAYFYLHYLVVYHFHRFDVFFRRRDSISSNETTFIQDAQKYKTKDVKLLIDYLKFFALYGPKNVILKRLSEVKIPGVSEEELQKVMKTFIDFSSKNYGQETPNQSQAAIHDTMGRAFKSASARVYHWYTENFLKDIGILNNFLRKVFPGCYITSPPKHSFTSEFLHVKEVLKWKPMAKSVEKYESRVRKMIKSMAIYMCEMDPLPEPGSSSKAAD